MRGNYWCKPVTFAVAVGMLLSGCFAKNQDLDKKIVKQIRQHRSTEFRESLTRNVEDPLTGTLTLSMAIARAIKYNLDNKVKQMETAVARQHLNLARTAYLPEIVYSAGYSNRSNDSGAVSESLLDGDVSLEYSTSQERSHTVTSLRAAWDIVDFGLAYYTSSQKQDEVNIAEERRRKVLQNITQDVQDAYWRAYISQELSDNLNEIFEESGVALNKSKSLTNKGTIDPKKALTEQKDILKIRYNLRSLQEKLAQGRIHLTALLNLPPGSDFVLEKVDAQEMLVLPDVSWLEDMALANRSELLIEDKKLSINKAEIRKSLLEMFPRLEVWGQWNTDNNKYLYNSDWGEAGIQVTWNLFESANSYSRKKVYKAEENLSKSRHLALSMAVVTQVHLAANRYAASLEKYEDAAELERVSAQLADVIVRDNKRVSGFEKVKANLQATATRLESMLAYADLQNALMRLYNTIGVDPLDNSQEGVKDSVLATSVDEHYDELWKVIFRQ